MESLTYKENRLSFTPDIKKAVNSFYTITMLWSAFFATANWLFFWRIFLTNGQIGVVDAVCFFAGMVAQVPTGAIADKIGRRRTMILGTIMMGVGYASVGFAFNGSIILIGYLVYSVGTSFYSGADDAYLYDYLTHHKLTHIWENIARRKQLIMRVGNTIAIFIGGYLYIWDVRLPSIVGGIFFLIIVYPLIRMRFMDSSQPSHLKEVTTGYFKHIWAGMRELLNRKMLPIILLILIIQGVTATIFIGGLLRPLMLERTSLPITDQSNFLALTSVPIIFLLFRSVKNRTMSAYDRAILWSFCVIVGFALNIPAHSLIGGLSGVVLILFGNYFIAPATSVLVNNAASAKYRATTLSTVNLLSTLPYIVAAPLIGLAADTNKLTLVIEIITTIMILAVLLSLIFHKYTRALA